MNLDVKFEKKELLRLKKSCDCLNQTATRGGRGQEQEDQDGQPARGGKSA